LLLQYDNSLFLVHNVALGFCLTVTYALLVGALVWRVNFVLQPPVNTNTAAAGTSTTTTSFAQHKMVYFLRGRQNF
jgi:hypothetical protein